MKWEYIITTFRSTREWVTDELNKLADEEWEAVAITSDGHVFNEAAKRQPI